MPKWIAYAGAWLAAAAAAVAVAFWGISIVGDQVTGERPAPLSAAAVDRRAAEVTASSTSTSTSTAGPTSTTGVDGAPAGDDPAAPATSTPTSGPAGTAPPSGTPTTTSPPPPPTTAAPAPAETRTYNLVGGSVALRFSPSGVTVVWANPNPGFDVESEPEHGNGVQVEFESETHKSRVDGWWDGGPQERVREEDETADFESESD